jgi:probable rRNA maturation factor
VLAVSFASGGEAPAETIFGLDDAALRRVIALALARAGVLQPVEISLLVTGDEGLRALNRDYRGRDEATDVLSFPLLDAPLAQAPAGELWQPPDEATSPREMPRAVPAAYDVAGELTGADGHGEDAEDAGNVEEVEDLEFLAPEGLPLHLGDIAISRDAVERQAAQAGHSPAWELAYLLAHGVLHLAGYDDHTDAGYRAMVAHQEAALAHAGISR